MKFKTMFLVLLLLYSNILSAYDFISNGIYYNITSDNTVEVTFMGNWWDGYKNRYANEITIPCSVNYNGNNYCVTAIGEKAFDSCTGLTSIIISNSVKNINDRAFNGCNGLTSITIPNSVTSIGNNAFYGCNGLIDIKISESVTNIGAAAFRDCYSLSSITIPSSVTSVGDYAFYDCISLASITINNCIASIGTKAFNNTLFWKQQLDGIIYLDKYCLGYKGDKPVGNLIIKDGTKSITNSSFADCSGLSNINIPHSVTNIGNKAFAGCKSLTCIDIPNSITRIEDYVFKDCTGLKNIHIPNSVKGIGYGAFTGCKSLIDINIPDSVTSIGPSAFANCTNLTSIIIPSSILNIENEVFKDCYRLNSIVMRSFITSIGNGAFDGCTSLANITIPNSTISIGDRGFAGCESLKQVTIPNSVINIGNSAFSGCSNLTKVEIPNSVTTIGKSAFSHCSRLLNVIIPNSITVINESTFYFCDSLVSVTIPKSVDSIGKGAFEFCNRLTNVHISDLASWCNIKFENNLSNPLYYALHLYMNGEEIKDLVVPNSVTNIERFAFLNFSGLTSVTIPNSVTNIGYCAFSNCDSLKSITLGKSVEKIEDYAFSKCISLNSIISLIPAESSFYPKYTVFENVQTTKCTLYVPKGAKSKYEKKWYEFTKIIELPYKNKLDLNISTLGYATMFLDFAAVIPEGVEVYTTARIKENCIIMNKVKGVLPANTGVIVRADRGNYIIVDSEETPIPIKNNLLKGSVNVSSIKPGDKKACYTLSNFDGEVGMYRRTLTDSIFKNNANEAYLLISSSDLEIYEEETDSSIFLFPQKLTLDFDNKTNINIHPIVNLKREDVFYDLNGLRIEFPTKKGIYIKNRKKYLVK